MNQTLTTTQEQRVDMERHAVVRSAGDLLWRKSIDLPREHVRTHVVNILLDSVEKQARWSA